MRHNSITKWYRYKVNNGLKPIKLEWMTWNKNIHSQRASSMFIYFHTDDTLNLMLAYD
ncbi:MAG: hypothetical protein O7D30_07100 [Rickettsia endosymbiont of Ixodes persulcatus]|nr:hypothetical protein [Rickettsia endosymbiont of Ixodes persulcatus]